MISNVGCKPYWMDHIQTDKENCSEASKLDKFLESFGDLNTMSTEEELTEEYNCLKPCIYMEYKVYERNNPNKMYVCCPIPSNISITIGS